MNPLPVIFPNAGHQLRLLVGSVAVVGLLVAAAVAVLVIAVNAGRLSLGLQEARNDDWESGPVEFPAIPVPQR